MNTRFDPWTLVRIDEEKIKANRYINPKIYILMPEKDTYVNGLQKLREECKKENNQNHPKHNEIYRPLTIKENIEARVNDFNTVKDENGATRNEQDRLRLFNERIHSCTGIINKKKSTKFKIVQVCEPLIVIDNGFNNSIPVDYSKIQCDELDSSKGKYNNMLKKQEFLDNEAWKIALHYDVRLHKEYAKIYYDILKNDIGCSFLVRQNTDEDELKGLFVYDIFAGSLVTTNNSSNMSFFIRVAQPR